MASLKASTLLSSCSCSSSNRVIAGIHVPKVPRILSSVPKIPSTKLFEVMKGVSDAIPLKNNVATAQIYDDLYNSATSKATIQLYTILEAVADRIEMHNNIKEQRENWNTLLLNSINMITLTASTMAGVAATGAAGMPILSLKLSSALLFSAATGLLLIMNKIQPSQLTEEQRNATRLFKQHHTQIETTLALGNPTEKDVKDAMKKVLALDKAYPLPLLGAMLEKFPAKFEPAVWWPSSSTEHSRKNISFQFHESKQYHKKIDKNGWNKELEMELRDVIEVVKRKDIEDYERLGNLALKINKILAISGPLLTGTAAAASAFVSQGSWAAIIPVMAGALATAVNAFEHGGQVGMILEMYRNCAGFFKLLENSVEETIEEEAEEREDGDLFKMKLALKLGRSLSQLRELARKSDYCRIEGATIDEFASKLF
ncbi:hypothetical protein L6164_035912 [Bauhinia variegata]|uniref:Uncharacterized protein n=1 Tax=Bauhinia variegata TaxID=167791 RepID=A0ACB9KFI5_BAUVA|nr:hypothetical protein L6164_035912 [Bauhinia variegata]